MFYFISSFPFLLAFDAGGLGFEFCVFVAGWRHALRSEWPFIYYYYYFANHRVTRYEKMVMSVPGYGLSVIVPQ